MHSILTSRFPHLFLSLSVLLLLLPLILLPTDGLIVRIPSSSEHCFFEDANKGEKVVGNFRVLEGGARDIDLKVRRDTNNFISGTSTRPRWRCRTIAWQTRLLQIESTRHLLSHLAAFLRLPILWARLSLRPLKKSLKRFNSLPPTPVPTHCACRTSSRWWLRS